MKTLPLYWAIKDRKVNQRQNRIREAFLDDYEESRRGWISNKEGMKIPDKVKVAKEKGKTKLPNTKLKVTN